GKGCVKFELNPATLVACRNRQGDACAKVAVHKHVSINAGGTGCDPGMQIGHPNLLLRNAIGNYERVSIEPWGLCRRRRSIRSRKHGSRQPLALRNLERGRSGQVLESAVDSGGMRQSA